MASRPEFGDHVLDLLAPLGPVTARRMFGGFGIYLDGVMFALIADDILYLKVDDRTRPDYEAAGSAPFRPRQKGKPFTMPYWEAPLGALEDGDELCAWANGALGAARRAKAGKSPADRRPDR
ncbi:MAG: TfoX/Sxy family protein [Proteobacteria bacterium]|nr:TfoX/Sxy family protein [Pseudomonadota bacterium]